MLIVIFSLVICAWNRDERLSEAVDEAEASTCSSYWEKVLKCFSIQNNWRSLMADSTPPNSINVINGIKYDELHFLNWFKLLIYLIIFLFFNRSLSCFLILFFHVFWFSFYTTSNPGVLFNMSEKVRYQWIANAALMVDSFFCIRCEVINNN